MDYWLPERSPDELIFREQPRPRRISDVGAKSSRSWVFRIVNAYLPRKQIWPGDNLAIRFSIRNDSAQEGVVYYIVTLRHVYTRAVLASTDELPDCPARIAWVTATGTATVQALIPWTALQRMRPRDSAELTLSIEIELWVPRRVRKGPESFNDRLMRLTRSGMFQKVSLFANPSVLYRTPGTDAFVSYAWIGAAHLAPNTHRAWVYGLADALAQAGVQAIVDYTFLSPAVVTNEVIARSIHQAANVVIVYSDAYLERIGRLGTGVSYEYSLLRGSSVRPLVKDLPHPA